MMEVKSIGADAARVSTEARMSVVSPDREEAVPARPSQNERGIAELSRRDWRDHCRFEVVVVRDDGTTFSLYSQAVKSPRRTWLRVDRWRTAMPGRQRPAFERAAASARWSPYRRS